MAAQGAWNGSYALPCVCMIEDDAAIRETLRSLLEDAGYQLIEAGDGRSGYTILRESTERLIALVDYKLPALDGCDLLELVASDAALRDRHAFIFVTASPQRAQEECGDTLEELNAPIVSKPFHIDEVLGAVADAAQRIAAEARMGHASD